MDRDPRTVYLGQFTDEHAEELAEALGRAGVEFWTKTSGRFVRAIFAADWGVRFFVAEHHLERARGVARDIAPDGLA